MSLLKTTFSNQVYVSNVFIKIFHMLNYFLFVNWFLYFIDFKVEALFIEKLFVLFFIHKSSSYIYKEYLQNTVERVGKSLWNYFCIEYKLKSVENITNESDSETNQDTLVNENQNQDTLVNEKPNQDTLVNENQNQDTLVNENQNQDNLVNENQNQDNLVNENQNQDTLVNENQNQDNKNSNQKQ